MTETTDVALEQQALDYVRAHGRSITDPAEVLRIAWQVYAWLFRPEHLQDPSLTGVTADELRMLHEMGTVMALNRGRSVRICDPCRLARVGVVVATSPAVR